jgi:hypothetical protein
VSTTKSRAGFRPSWRDWQGTAAGSMPAPVASGAPSSVFQRSGPGVSKEDTSTRKARASVPTLAQALWWPDVSGPSPYEGTRDREPTSARAGGKTLEPAARHALGRSSRKRVSVSASRFWLRCSLAVQSIRAIARSIPWPDCIRSLYALTLAAPIRAVGTTASMPRRRCRRRLDFDSHVFGTYQPRRGVANARTNRNSA